jgi:serine/threonine protein kinase/FixJ family two-component response regulator
MEKELYPELPILLVDDNEDFLDGMKVNLKLQGINNVECCSDSLEVMNLLKEKKFSLILLDIIMPYIKGDDLLPLIVEKYPDIPVILLTVVGQISSAFESGKKGAFDYLTKPIDSDKLIAAIKKALKSKKLNWVDHPELKILKEKLSARYEPMEYLGGGGFCKVFRVKDKNLERECALKVLNFHRFNELRERDRERTYRQFTLEAKAYAKCRHPNIVPIYDIGGDDRFPYFIMEYIDGETLKEIISRKGKLELAEVVKISQGVLSGLGYLHQKALIHRNLKPANIMLEKGTDRTVLLNADILRDLNKPDLYEDGAIVGTFNYMPPEQWRDSKRVVTETDIYSFGVTIYEMLTGELPFEGKPIEIMYKHVNESVPDVRLKNPNLPSGIEKIISKAMAKEPKYRYRNAQEFLDDLKKLKNGNIQKISIKEDYIFNAISEHLRDRYIISDSLIGTGTYSKVYFARHRIYAGDYAIKIMDFDLILMFIKRKVASIEIMKEEFKKKCDEFITEAKFFYTFSGNPNILNIVDQGYVPIEYEKDVFQIPYLVSKFIKGVSLKEFIDEKGPLALESVLYISEKILSAINSIHEQGFFYLNLNPAKILIADEYKTPILIDAGFSYDYIPGFTYEFSTKVKTEPERFNAISYLSPIYRKRNNKGLKTASIICMFGVLLYEMITGEKKIRNEDNFLDTLYEKLSDPVAGLKQKNPNLITGIVRIIKKAIAKDYRLRYRNVKRVLNDLRKVKRNENAKKFYNNDEISLLIEKKRYWDSISIISKTEELNLADDNTRTLKEKVIKSLSDDEEQSFKKPTKEGKSTNYPDSGCTLGRNETIGSTIEGLDKTPIITVYGIPGIGKSVFIHEIRKNESHNNRLYKRVIAKPGMTVNDLFQELSLLLGCRDMLNRPELDLSKQSDFPFLETEAQYRVASLIHLDDAQYLFYENQFCDNAVKEFLVAVTRYYPDTRIILECRIVPPAGIFPANLHQSIRLHGIDEGSMILYFRQPFKNNPDCGWELEEDEQELVLKNLCSKGKGNIHPLAMVLLANRAFQSNKRPLQIIKDPEAMKELIDESGDLILNDLNKTTLQTTGPNMSQNLKMYREDIPVYLSESLQKYIRELMGDVEIEDLLAADTSVDKRENELRNAVSKKLYKEGKKHLQEIIKLDKERKERLKEEFGYIYDVENPEADENQWAQKQGQIEWRRKVWKVLSIRNDFELMNIEPGEEEEDKKDIQEAKIDEHFGIQEQKVSDYKAKKTSEEIGEELEKAVLKLFKDFFNICEEDKTLTLTNARQQGKGLQFGHDLKFVCGRLGDKEIRFLIECKNYSEKIATRDIADKLMQVDEYYDKDYIDHWILISPNEDVSNELENLIESWEKKGKFSFKVQAWTPATRVKEFFGLNPAIYDKIIKVPDLEIHPKDWSEQKKQEVIEFWKEKLEPPLRLPVGWEDYLRQPGKLRLEPKEIEFEQRYNNDDYVDMNCKDETGTALPLSLEEKIHDWLEDPGSPTIFLLGEFGDGKTFFTYVLTRKLMEKFRESPKNGWIPVRFALKNFSKSYDPDKPKNIQDFLQYRLNEFRTDIAGWNELRSCGYKILAILDGFDEISKELDPETIHRNIDILINFYENDYFSDMKILITSRKHFFENHKEKEWLIDKLGKPQLVHLAPIDRKITEDYLRKYAAGIGKEEKFNKLKDFHDPIGLASKPLFLDMVQVSLENLPEEDLNEYTLYETYILESLKRKENFLYDKRKETPKHKIIDNLLKGLELVAQELHQSRKEFVYLSDIKGRKYLQEWLWTLSEPDEKTTGDETGRMAERSLLKRFNVKDQPKGKTWPVDFCHRSMREYFVGRAVCNLLENDKEEAETFLINCFLTHEILFFAGEIMKHRTFDYESGLLDLIGKTKNVEKIDRIKLGCLGGNAVNLLYRYKGKLPGDDWKNLVLNGAILPGADLSGKDFSGTSLQYANLDNVNFANSNFSNCNLEEVRIEETTPVQSIAVSPNEKILSLYNDGIIREWSCQRPHGATAANLSGNKAEKDMKLMALPGNDLTVLHDRFLYFYDRNDLNLDLKAAIEIKPNIRLIKATRDYLLLNEQDGKQNRLFLLDLKKEAIVKSFICLLFTLCDHLDDCALVIFNQNEELQLIDITPGKRTPLIIPTGQKVACISTCKCSQSQGQYLLGLGLYNGAVQVWQIQVNQWKCEKILDQLLHEPGKPVKDICFIDECRIVSGGLDKTIKLLTFNPTGEAVGEPIEFKMALQCRGMKIDGVIRENIEGKKLKELIDKATHQEPARE